MPNQVRECLLAPNPSLRGAGGPLSTVRCPLLDRACLGMPAMEFLMAFVQALDCGDRIRPILKTREVRPTRRP